MWQPRNPRLEEDRATRQGASVHPAPQVPALLTCNHRFLTRTLRGNYFISNFQTRKWWLRKAEVDQGQKSSKWLSWTLNLYLSTSSDFFFLLRNFSFVGLVKVPTTFTTTVPSATILTLQVAARLQFMAPDLLSPLNHLAFLPFMQHLPFHIVFWVHFIFKCLWLN